MVSVILIRPQLSQNIGSVARVMKNFGLNDLRIVSPRDELPNEVAESMAAGGADIIRSAAIFPNLEDAIFDLKVVYATTVRRRDIVKEVISSRNMADEIQQKFKGSEVGIMFGPERTGIENREIRLANKIIEINTNKKYGSLNLAQAVGIVAYELFDFINNSRQSNLKKAENLIEDLADRGKISALVNHLRDELEGTKMYRVEEKKEKMLINLSNIFSRIPLTSQEVQTLRGVIKSLANKESS